MNFPTKTIVLVGNPNSGKTTLFNELTGALKRVGNWSGVTVDSEIGHFAIAKNSYEIVDLPGIYTLISSNESSPDEKVTCQFLTNKPHSLVLNVIDAQNLERNLYLTLQVLEQNLPIIMVLNRVDVAEKEGYRINSAMLAEQLGCCCIPIIARKGKGIETLKNSLFSDHSTQSFQISYPEPLEKQLINLSETCRHPRFLILRWLEGETCPFEYAEPLRQAKALILKECGADPDIVIAKTRYEFIESVIEKSRQFCHGSQIQPPFRKSHFLDKITSHRYLGLPVFFAVMYALFFFAIHVGGLFQDFFEQSAQAIFVEGMESLLRTLQAPEWSMALLVSGLGMGLSTVLTFVPVIGAMFLALAFLEDSGYMARAVFVVDKLMRTIGLPGKSFVPLIVGFGCNVPAIVGMRTLDNRCDRILAVMMSPFMSCGARLAIFTVFVAVFFPENGQNIVFLLYIIGICMAVLTGLLLKKTVLKGEIAPLLLEMPSYQWPHWRSLWRHSWHRLRRFIFNAGKLILPVCFIIGVLNNITMQGKWLHAPSEQSVLSTMGQKMVPLFKPLGMEEENWPAAVGLLTGILAKEVIIGTLNSLYSQEEVATIPTNSEINYRTYGEMIKRFNGQANAFAYLLFVLLYFPCVSATAAMVREVQKGWTVFSVCWTTGLAYAIAVIYFQCATFGSHPLQSVLWVSILLSVGLIAILGIQHYGKNNNTLVRILPTPIVVK